MGRKEVTNEMYLYMTKIMKPLRERVWPLMTIRKRRWGVRLSEELGENPKNSRSGRVSEEFATVLEEFESAVSEPAELLRRIPVFILRERRGVPTGSGRFFLEC